MTAIREVSPDERPFRRVGLGWEFRPPEAPVVLTFDRVVDQRSETWAEVLVKRADGGHLLRRRVNLLGGTSMSGMVKELDELTGAAGWPWRRILISGCESTLEAHRAGEPMETFEGEVSRPPGVRWLCGGLVMEHVPNAWIAAASTGKSTFAAAICVHHAFGEPFLGREVKRGTPLYLDWESTSDDFAEKVHDTAYGLGERSVPKIHRQRMRGALRHRVHDLAQRIDRHGISLLVVDAVSAAGGAMGESSYEAVALDLEHALVSLPPVTVLLLDHVTGEDVKNGAVPLKGRGSVRKLEFCRNQWTLSLDRDLAPEKRHVVGWTHTKINRGVYEEPFGVEVLHHGAELDFRVLGAGEVGPLYERMPTWRKMLSHLDQTGPLPVKEIALGVLGKDDKTACAQVRNLYNRDMGRHFLRYSDGSIASRSWAYSREAGGEASVREVPRNGF